MKQLEKSSENIDHTESLNGDAALFQDFMRSKISAVLDASGWAVVGSVTITKSITRPTKVFNTAIGDVD